MSAFQGEVTQASRGWIRDTSNSRKIHFRGVFALWLKLTIESYCTDGLQQEQQVSEKVH